MSKKHITYLYLIANLLSDTIASLNRIVFLITLATITGQVITMDYGSPVFLVRKGLVCSRIQGRGGVIG